MLKKVIRSGHSLAVTVPAVFVKDLGLKPGDSVEIMVNRSQNKITYRFSGSTQLSLSPEILKKR